jgi:hypothetical protein
MIRIIGTRLLIPKGDTGFFSLPNKGIFSEDDVAVFSVRDPLTQTTVIEKLIDASSSFLLIEIEKEDTFKLNAGKYYWDIKLYRRPIYDEDNLLIDALEVDSYYSAFEQPLLIIKEVSKNYV